MHNAIQIVFSETMTFDDQGMQVSSTSLQHWSSCSFTGEDTLLEVMDKLGNFVVTIANNVQFCLDIPFISDLMSYLQPSENKCICVSIHMSFDDFRTYVRENNDRRSLHSVAQNEDNVEDSRTNETRETEPSKSAEQQQAESAWRDTFYDVCYEKFKTMRNSTLINKEKYNCIEQSLLHYQGIRQRGTSLAVIPSDARQYAKIYDLKSNIGQRCLYRNGLLVTTYEDVFDTMQVTKPDFDALTLTIEEASAKHNVLGGKSYCRCQKDCILVPKCSCIALGKLCRDKCHGSSKKLTHIRCSNCVTTEHATHNVGPKLRKRG